MDSEKPVSSPDMSIGRILNNLTTNTQTLVRKEIQHVQVKVTEKVTTEVKEKGSAIGVLAGAGIFALFGLGFLGVMLILGLQAWFDLAGWLAALIVMALYFIIAAILGLIGRSMLKKSSAAEGPTEDDAHGAISQSAAHVYQSPSTREETS